MVGFIKIPTLRRQGYEALESAAKQNIALGKDEKEKLECTGYKKSWYWQCFLIFICFIGCGIPYLFVRWYPQCKAYLGLKKCPLDVADTILVKGTGGYKALCNVYVTSGSEMHAVGQPLKFFVFQFRRIVWNTELRQYQLLRGLANDKYTFNALHDYSDGLSRQDHVQWLALYGKNEVHILVPSYCMLLIDEVLNPFYIFEILSILFWIIDDYIIYSFCVISFCLSSIIVSLIDTKKNNQDLREVMAEGNTDIVTVWHKSSESVEETIEVKTQDLVPGDVIVIPPYGCLMHCDALLLSGNCIVNESVLTGESVPVTKTAPPFTDDIYEPNSIHMRHTLYHGTKVLQTRFYNNNKVLALVVRTGSETSKGQLVRSMIYTPKIGFKLYRDSIKFLLLMFVIALVGMVYSIYLYFQHGANLSAIILRSLDIVTIVVPPALPAAMTVGVVYSQRRLKSKDIFSTSPSAINVCGKVNLVCFDKTGTLTEEGLDLYGVIPHYENEELDEQNLVVDFTSLKPTSPLTQTMSCCHSLTEIENHLCGDPLDTSMFTALDWEIEEPTKNDTEKFDLLVPTVVRPKGSKAKLNVEEMLDNVDNTETDFLMPLEIGIVRQFTFSSSSQCMSVIARVLGARAFTVYTKGAPEKIMSICKPNTVPSNFERVLSRYTSSGFRVIALAYKSMPNKFNFKQAQRISRDEIEKDLNFLGLLLLINTLKPESAPVIAELRKAAIKCVMITGDNLLTAVSVSRDCGILNTDVPVDFVSVDITNGKPSLLLNKSYVITNLYDPTIPLAIDGNNWALLKKNLPHLVPLLICRIMVFARMSPQHKRELVEAFQSVDYVVAMVGDGANDCSALRAADVGISLSQAEASIAAPFTSRKPNVTCVVELIKEGRCALVTSFGIFKYMALYSLVQFMSVIFLYEVGVELSNMQFLYVDLVITTFIAMVMGHPGPAKYLHKHKPITTLIAAKNVIPLLLQIFIIGVIQKSSLYFLSTRVWFNPVDPNADGGGNIQCWENSTVYMVSCCQFFILACAFNKGKPHRQPFYTNWTFLGLIITLTVFTLYLLIHPYEPIADFFELMSTSAGHELYRIQLVLIILVHLILSLWVENVFPDSWIFKWILKKLSCKKKPKNLYKIYERCVDIESNSLNI